LQRKFGAQYDTLLLTTKRNQNASRHKFGNHFNFAGALMHNVKIPKPIASPGIFSFFYNPKGN
jgi:hypothetical protein